MENKNVDVDTVIAYLNELLNIDRDTIESLVEVRVPCNIFLQQHETVQTHGNRVGILGVLNGLFGINEDGWGYISVSYDIDGNITCFERTQKEHENKEPPKPKTDS